MKNRQIMAMLLAGVLALGSVPVWGAEEDSQLADMPVQTEESDGKVDSEELQTTENEGQQETDSEPVDDRTDETQNEEDSSITEATGIQQVQGVVSESEKSEVSEEPVDEEENSEKTEIPDLENTDEAEENSDGENAEKEVQETTGEESEDTQEEESTEALQADNAVTEEGIVIAEAFPDERIREAVSEISPDFSGENYVGDDGILDQEEISQIKEFSFHGTGSSESTEPLNLEGLQYLTELESLEVDLYGSRNQQITNTEIIHEIIENGKLTRVLISDAGLTNADFLRGSELTYLQLTNNQLTNLDFLTGGTFTTLNVSNNQITDISGLKNIQIADGANLDLSNNRITDISALNNRAVYAWIDLSDNMIRDISPLVNNRVDTLYLNNNEISVLPDEWPCLLKIVNLYLENNRLESVAVLAERYQAGLSTSLLGNDTLSKEQIFRDIYDTRPRSMLSGNTIDLPTQYRSGIGPSSTEDLLDPITFTVEDTSVADIVEENKVLAKQPGTTDIVASMNGVQLSIPLEVVGAIEPTVVETDKIPEVQAVVDDLCVTWDEEGALWYYAGDQGEKIAENVNSFVSFAVENDQGTEKWANCYILDNNGDLYLYSKASATAPFIKELLYQSVESYNASGEILYTVLTKDHILYNCQDGTMAAEQVKDYTIWFDKFTDEFGYYAWTTDNRIIRKGEVIAENVEEAVFYQYMTDAEVVYRIGTDLFIHQSYGSLVGDGTDEFRITSGAQKIISYEYFLNLQGQVVKWSGGSSQVYLEVVDEHYANPALETVYVEDRVYWIDADHTLWLNGSDTPVAQNVEKILQFTNGSYGYLADHQVVDIMTGAVLDNVKEVTGSFFLSTDGVVYEIKDGIEGSRAEILADVVHISQPVVSDYFGTYPAGDSCYMVRKDGTVWKYNSQNNPSAVPVKLELKETITGDVDGNGEIQVADMLSVLHNISGSVLLGEGAAEVGDIDGDGQVSVKDLLRILHYISGASEEL